MGPETSNNQIFTTSFQRHPNFRRPKLLPVELLVEVFLLSLPPLNCGQAQQRTTLALVCRLWNDIIERTPILWSRISFKDTSSYVKRSLRKSAKSPIDVYVVCSDRKIQYDTDHTYSNSRSSWERSWGCVVEEKHYVKPRLRAIGSTACRECCTLLTSSWAPRLRELVLDNIELAPRAMSLPTLSRLVIQNRRISPSEILTALAEFPNLTMLRLSGCDAPRIYRLYRLWFPERSGGALGSTPLVELASLRQLTFDNVNSDVIQDVLPRLKLPSDCKVSLTSELDGRDPKASFLDPALSQYHETFHAVGEIVRVRISLQLYQIYVILQFLRWDITLRLPGPASALSTLEWFGISTNRSAATSHLEDSPINSILPPSDIPISLKFRSDLLPIRLQPSSPLLNLGCISKIEIAGMTSYNYSRVLFYFTEPLVPQLPATTPSTTRQEPAGNSGSEVAMQHVAETWPVPGLCELALQSSEDHVLRAVTEFIKRRSASGVGLGHNRAASGRSPAAQLPARLKRIEFDGEDDTNPESECRRNLPSDVKAWPSALLDLLEILDEDVQVFWFGKRISKAGIMD